MRSSQEKLDSIEGVVIFGIARQASGGIRVTMVDEIGPHNVKRMRIAFLAR
jgi:hypothetical protein